MKPGQNTQRDIRIVFSIFAAIFSLIGWKNHPSYLANFLFAISLLLLLAIIFKPLLLSPLLKKWLKVTHAIGKFNTQILLFIVYFIMFVPVGTLMRLMGKDPLKKKWTKDLSSYWEEHELAGLKDKTRYQRQF